ADEPADLVLGEVVARRHETLDVAPREDRDDAGRGLRLAYVDRADARMGMRRAQEGRMRLPRPADVVGVAAGAGDEALVLDPGNPGADAGRCHRDPPSISFRPLPEVRSAKRCPSKDARSGALACFEAPPDQVRGRTSA